MAVKPTTADAYRLMHDGSLALAECERHGMRIDVARLDRTIAKVGRRIDKLTEELKSDGVWRSWQRRFGGKANVGSRAQLAKVVYGEMGHKSEGETRTGRERTDEESLVKLDLPFVRSWLEIEKLKKLKSTYLMGVRSEVVDGFLHPSFSVHLACSHRSSSSDPNFQNIPIRDPKIGKLIRRCFVPRRGHVLVEVDYSALEFKICACFWRDVGMVEYASDPAKDVHRDMAVWCYRLKPERVTKDVRFYAKNQFVFPQLYGSVWANCARNLWDVIGSAGLTDGNGVGLYEHLRAEGYGRLGDCSFDNTPEEGTFESHVYAVERRFNKLFPEWSRKKEDWLRTYRRRGWFDMLTGFRCAGVYSRNQLFNMPVQGPAFHCLLWSLTRLVKRLRKLRMESLVIGEIHDSIIADVPEAEVEDYLAEVKRIMTEDVRRAWPWIIVPLQIDADEGRENWWDKEKVKL